MKLTLMAAVGLIVVIACALSGVFRSAENMEFDVGIKPSVATRNALQAGQMEAQQVSHIDMPNNESSRKPDGEITAELRHDFGFSQPGLATSTLRAARATELHGLSVDFTTDEDETANGSFSLEGEFLGVHDICMYSQAAKTIFLKRLDFAVATPHDRYPYKHVNFIVRVETSNTNSIAEAESLIQFLTRSKKQVFELSPGRCSHKEFFEIIRIVGSDDNKRLTSAIRTGPESKPEAYTTLVSSTDDSPVWVTEHAKQPEGTITVTCELQSQKQIGEFVQGDWSTSVVWVQFKVIEPNALYPFDNLSFVMYRNSPVSDAKFRVRPRSGPDYGGHKKQINLKRIEDSNTEPVFQIMSLSNTK